MFACVTVQAEYTHTVDEVGCLHVCKYVQPECTHWRKLGVGMFASVCNLSVPTGGCCVFVSECAT